MFTLWHTEQVRSPYFLLTMDMEFDWGLSNNFVLSQALKQKGVLISSATLLMQSLLNSVWMT